MIIALTGYAGSGKSTAAQRLVNAHGFTLVKFAGPLKSMMRALGLTDREIEGDAKETPCALLGGNTPRHAMQTLGTEWGRALIDSNLWVNVAMAGVDAVLDMGGKVVIDDLRFGNEVEAIKGRGGIIVRIERPGFGPVNSHSSESNYIPVDYALINDSSEARLHYDISAMLRHYQETEPCE